MSASRLGAVGNIVFSRSPGAKGQSEVGPPLPKLKVSYVGSGFRSSWVSPNRRNCLRGGGLPLILNLPPESATRDGILGRGRQGCVFRGEF